MKFLQELTPQSLQGAIDLITKTTDHDGIPPVSEHVLLHLRHGGDKNDRHIVVEDGGKIVGYAHLDLTDQVEGPSTELLIDPAYRSQGLGSELLREVEKIAGDRLRLWAHGDLPGSQKLAKKGGFERIRTVAQMRRTLTEALPEITIPIRTFKVGSDEKEWLALNNRAFINHPDQGKWSERDLEIRKQEDWFDPQGFFIAEVDQKMSGFCWVKIHGGKAHSHAHSHSNSESQDPTDLHGHGEIYVMGVDPVFHGRGIGRAVVLAGLRYMRNKGIFSAMLYVEADNRDAIKLYTKVGFTEWGRDILYRKN
ncbi:MAG: mycothiol synthase [Actinomycetota bacterium]|nr:mycothiol synthase [Actinomycetota bacterium]